MLQHLTAIGRIMTGDIYQVEMAPNFKPYRLDVEFIRCHTTPIKPLIHNLSFIKNKTKWGAAFRSGHLKIQAEDFKLIDEAMGAWKAIKENVL